MNIRLLRHIERTYIPTIRGNLMKDRHDKPSFSLQIISNINIGLEIGDRLYIKIFDRILRMKKRRLLKETQNG